MNKSNLTIVRGGAGSGKVNYAQQLAASNGSIALDLGCKTFYSYSRTVSPDLFANGSLAAVRKLLDAGFQVVVADVFAKKTDIDSFAELCAGTQVFEMNCGQTPQDWEAYPAAILVTH